MDSPSNSLCLCTGSLGCRKGNDIPYFVRKYSALNRIGFMHLRNVRILEDGSFEESGHWTGEGFRPDHGRDIWGEGGRPGYGLFDRALGTAYINGLIEANGGRLEG